MLCYTIPYCMLYYVISYYVLSCYHIIPILQIRNEKDRLAKDHTDSKYVRKDFRSGLLGSSLRTQSIVSPSHPLRHQGLYSILLSVLPLFFLSILETETFQTRPPEITPIYMPIMYWVPYYGRAQNDNKKCPCPEDQTDIIYISMNVQNDRDIN